MNIFDVRKSVPLAVIIGSSAVMATALLDHTGILAVMNNPVSVRRCLEIAAVAAIMRVVINFGRREFMVDDVAVAACAGPIGPNGGSPIGGRAPALPPRTL